MISLGLKILAALAHLLVAMAVLRGGEISSLQSRAAEHWSFQALSKAEPGSSIDGYVDQGLMREGLDPYPRAGWPVLLRRLSFDLIGLPPTVEEMDPFAGDEPDAASRVIDRLLASPHFGERWARHWLDVVRYSETKGHVTDIERPFAWKYRDYVIDALNDDLPYDEFVREHLAGDLLEPGRPGKDGQTNVSPAATGALFFHEMHFMAVDPVKQRWDEIDAQIDVVSQAFLGLTMACARCHDHKTDAISQRDYYALAGFFYSTEQGKARTAPRDECLPEEVAKAERTYANFLASKTVSRREAQTKKNGEYFPISEELGIQSPGDYVKLRRLMDRLTKLDPSWSAWVRAARDVRGVDVPLLRQGDYKLKGERVRRRFIEVLGGQVDLPVFAESESGRLYLAEQIASPHNPLTARVWVNRLWHHLFGRGLHLTPNDLGRNGHRPTHPRLLDYLAWRLIERDWSTKAVIREIALSDVYQRASATPGEADPENLWLSHQNGRRLQAEAIRDAILQSSGSLDRAMSGPSVQPWVPPYATANKPGNVPKSGPVDGRGRRSVYLCVRRNFPDPFLKIFDFPDPGASTGRRELTSPPSQALAMMNSPFVHHQAARWAAAARREGTGMGRMFRTALGRWPTDAELGDLERLASSEDVAHVILNMFEFRYVD